MRKLILIFIVILTSNFANSQKVKKKTSTKSSSVQYSEEKALELIADYYDFYNSDEKYENPVVRRISNNVFYVKVEYCSGGNDICFDQKSVRNENGTTEFIEVRNEHFWDSKVLILKIQSSTKYTVTVKEDY
jgi:hypothetical protein